MCEAFPAGKAGFEHLSICQEPPRGGD
jgi:hypothetical protein